MMEAEGFLLARLELFMTSPTDFLLLWREPVLPTLSLRAKPVLTDDGAWAGVGLGLTWGAVTSLFLSFTSV